MKIEKITNLYESDRDYIGRLTYSDFRKGFFDEEGKRFPIKATKILMKDLKRGQVFRHPKQDGTFSTTFSANTNASVSNRLWARYKSKGAGKGVYVPYDDADGESIELSNVESVSKKDKKVMAYNVIINDWRGE